MDAGSEAVSTGKGGQGPQENEQAASLAAVTGGAQAPSIFPKPLAFVVTGKLSSMHKPAKSSWPQGAALLCSLRHHPLSSFKPTCPVPSEHARVQVSPVVYVSLPPSSKPLDSQALRTIVVHSNRALAPSSQCSCPLCFDAPEHEDGAQAARWALLGYGKDGSRPPAGTLGVDPIKGVPEKGAELLHTLLSTCIGGIVSAGAAV
eukprot:269300-Pelagomonas_calceolata.AAC.8